MISIASFEQTPLLEIRTAAGAVYLCPSRLQRMRLQWTFRHFHVLPPQVLSRHDQRLIERLAQSAVVTPRLPVADEAILGVVEKAGAASPAYELATVLAGVQSRQGRQNLGADRPWITFGGVAAGTIGIVLSLASMQAILLKKSVLPVAQAATSPSPLASPGVADSRLPALAVAATPGPLIEAQRLVASPLGVLLEIKPTQDFSFGKAAVAVKPAVALRAPTVAPPHAVMAPAVIAPTVSEPAPAVMRLVTELPPGRFARPVVARRNLAGEVELQAMIGPDGSVKQVTALRGNPQLAQAGIRAVRQWQYAPMAVQGLPLDAVTRIKMNFFGEDAVSIASVAK